MKVTSNNIIKLPLHSLVGKGKNLEPARGLLPRMQWHPTPVLLPGESHGQRSLMGYSPRGHKELDTTEAT